LTTVGIEFSSYRDLGYDHSAMPLYKGVAEDVVNRLAKSR